MDTLKRLVSRYLLRYWRQAVVTYLCMTVTTVTGLVVPMVIRNVIDVGLAGRNPGLIDRAALIIIGISAASAVFSFGQRYLHAWLAENMAYDIRNDLYDHVQHLSFAFHDRTETGQLISRCTSDVNAVLRFSGWAIMQAINILLMTVIALAVLFTTDWKLAAVSILPLPVVAVMAVVFRQRIRPIFRAIQQQFAVMTTVLQENLLGAQVVRAFAREQYEMRKFNVEVDRVRRQRLQSIRYWVTNNQTNIFLFSLCTTLLLLYGGPRAIRGELTVGVLVAFSSYLALLAGPIQSIGEIVNSATEATAAGERIFEILDTQSEVADAPDAVEAPQFQGTVAFEGVSFRYSGREPGRVGPLTITDVSFEAAPNQTIAVVGSTGSGKSTLVSLIPRFYDVTQGAVKIDGVDIRRYTLESLRRQVGIVMQEPLLFAGTVRENIAYGRPDATDEEITRAAKVAQAHDFITAFPDGYDTFVGERGYTLSGGQRQRVSIARAILLDPRILVLDDATAAVDTETEHQIQQALAEVMVGRTTFVIAQRLTTAKGADLVLVMDHGKVAERGTHAELLEQGGLYRRIYDLQLRDQEEQLARDGFGAVADGEAARTRPALGKENGYGR
ncbi:MAG: ABC transporter ATP-binding protein [Anaerolineae bacterium]|nr:ABC transporter ATP-binding protein [Anaerolineae bacterium]